jgi:Gluconate 2-dehydrogenase subunit 3
MGAEDDGRITRRHVLTKLGGGLAGLSIGAKFANMNRAEAGVTQAPLQHFSSSEGQLLAALGDVLVPGAADAGIVQYVDDQLGRPEPLLFLKYMDYLGSYIDFYKQGLGSLENYSRSQYRDSFLALGADQRVALVREISQKNPGGWKEPPAPLFYFVVRNDAIDVTYGTPAGFAKLGVPYMAMIEPPHKW